MIKPSLQKKTQIRILGLGILVVIALVLPFWFSNNLESRNAYLLGLLVYYFLDYVSRSKWVRHNFVIYFFVGKDRGKFLKYLKEKESSDWRKGDKELQQ